MVGQIEFIRGAGRGERRMTYVGPLAMMTVTVYGPEGLPQWRLRRRLGRAEKTLLRGGARRVVLPEGFPYAQLLTGLRPVETLPFYRAIADVLALGALEWLHL